MVLNYSTSHRTFFVETSGLLTYNVYSDWDRPVINNDTNPPLPSSSVVPPAKAGPRGVPSPLIGSWVYITQLRFMIDIATALGHTNDAARFAADEARSTAAFVVSYFRSRVCTAHQGLGKDTGDDDAGCGLAQPDSITTGTTGGTFGDGSLTQMAANALALQLFPDADSPESMNSLENVRSSPNPLSPEQRQAAIAALVDAVITAGNHSDAGIISFSALFPVMSSAIPEPEAQVHPNTLALAMNLKRDYPSFGYVMTILS